MARLMDVLVLGLLTGCSSDGGATGTSDAATGGATSTGGIGGAGTGGTGLRGTGGMPGDASADTGGSCEAGGGPVVTLACGQSRPGAIAVDATNVYWANYGTHSGDGMDGSIMRVPIGGGTQIALATAQNGPVAIVVRGTSVYWVNCAHPSPGINSGCTIMKAPVSGGATTVLARNQTDVRNLAVDATGVYWGSGEYCANPACVSFQSGAIRTVTIDGGTPVDLGPAGDPVAIALDSASVYWTEPSQGLIRKMPLGGGAQTTLFSGAGTWSIAVDATRAYWLAPESLMTIPIDGGSPAAIACWPAAGAVASLSEAMTLDATSVYWTRATDGALMRTRINGAGSGESTIVTAAQSADHIVVDDTNVYWTTRAEVRKVAKPNGAGTSASDGGASCASRCDAGTMCSAPTDGAGLGE
jgi:hypothetical protein